MTSEATLRLEQFQAILHDRLLTTYGDYDTLMVIDIVLNRVAARLSRRASLQSLLISVLNPSLRFVF